MLAKEFIDLLDELIRLRIQQSSPHTTNYASSQAEQYAELTKNKLAEYLASINAIE